MNTIIYKEKLASTDPRLKRHIHHDSRSKNYAFDTTGLVVTDIVHQRHIGILNQGQVGSCTGNAGIGDLATTPLFEALPTPLKYSLDEAGALALYSDAEMIDGDGPYPPNDHGSSGLSIANALKNAGLISGYQHTFTLQDALKAGSVYPFITGVSWYTGMFTPDADGRVHLTGTVEGGHEFQLSEIDLANTKIWFFNSWDDTWGVKGRFYMTFDDYGTLLAQNGDVTVLLPRTIPTPTPTPIKPSHYFGNDLKQGTTSPDVLALQQCLNYDPATKLQAAPGALGSIGHETLYFGPITLDAVRRFQTKYGIPSTGFVGPLTRAELNKLFSSMNISPSGISLIEGFEGFVGTPYVDASGIITIGFGFTHDPQGNPITMSTPTLTQAEATVWFNTLIIDYVNGVLNALTKTVSQNQLDAIVDMAYNCGVGAFEQSSICNKINSNKPVLESDFTQYCMIKGVKNAGLLARRQKEFALFIS